MIAAIRRVGPAAIRLGATLAGLALLLLGAGPASVNETPKHAGSTICAECHAETAEAWAASDHARAWTLPSDVNVLGDFSGVTFEHGGRTARFFREGETFLIETEGADGERRAFEVVGVAGVNPLQQYLLSPEPGRTQVFDIGWDVTRARWYPVFPGLPPSHGDGMHWTGPYKSWEARCAGCHATGYSRNYDAETNDYAPRMAEIGVGCEACHGPGSDHVAWARAPGAEAGAGPQAMGLTFDPGASQQAEVMLCLACHSRRQAMQDAFPAPGTDYHDAFSITPLREGVYHPDGSILDEAFEGGSFLQSKMHARGVRCSNCHEPHSGGLRAEGNAVCTQCHSPAGAPDFPSLPLRAYDGPEHHFHAEGGEGARCVSCHMIERVYMGADPRRDHSFRVPRPDLADTGAPDACTDCHADRDAAWAAAELSARFPESAHRGPHFATTFAAARREPWSAASSLLEIAEAVDAAGIVRATALELLGAVDNLDAAERVASLLEDPDPLVRAAAAGPLRSLPPEERLTTLAPLLVDRLRSVREAATVALADARPQPEAPGAAALVSARREWREALAARADYPETHLQIGGAALQARDFAGALQAFERAALLDPQMVEAWSMIVRLNAALGKPAAAQDALARGLEANPGNGALLSLR